MNIQELPDYDLSRLLLRAIWKFQDASGLSHRTIESRMLESAIGLMPTIEIGLEFDFQELLEEAERRKSLRVKTAFE